MTSFGSPRVGNRMWAMYYESLKIPTKRYALDSDLAVHLPPLWTGYTHISQQYHINKMGNEVKECVTSGPIGESKECLKPPKDGYTIENLMDHMHYFNLTLRCNPSAFDQ